MVGMTMVSLVSLAVLAKRGMWEPSPSAFLRTIVQIEQQEMVDPATMQQLSVLLAQCGRETEAESASRPLISGDTSLQHFTSPPIELSKLQPLPWRETITKIAIHQQLIIIMEAHNAPKHRQWIEQTLPILRTAGFRDYAAEDLAEPGPSLTQRGYPLSSTGVYVSDPHFGNVLRTAIKLDFDLHTYEAYEKTMDRREYGQAANLAKLFLANPKMKLVVHAGYGHVFKTHRDADLKMMAAYLWEMTGIEPYCIWQTYPAPEDRDACQLAELLSAGSEPIMLIPAPAGRQSRVPPGSVDAFVVHSPSVGGPDQRVHSFKTARQRVAGEWKGSEWPVLMGTYKTGESADAVALDQVMLREGEKDFVLWVPHDDYEIRIFAMKGQVNSSNSDGTPIFKITTVTK